MTSSRSARAATPILLREPVPTRLERLSTPRNRQKQDTEQGCRALAADDLARAADMTCPLPRARMEHSAATWIARADLLRRVEAGTLRRLEAAVALVEAG
ncbi:MAG TPA: hypothetical protein VH331_17450 [Allosphingosinicella sp.]|nr:hypothetical protein [Allosphingosinicella sp.]